MQLPIWLRGSRCLEWGSSGIISRILTPRQALLGALGTRGLLYLPAWACQEVQPRVGVHAWTWSRGYSRGGCTHLDTETRVQLGWVCTPGHGAAGTAWSGCAHEDREPRTPGSARADVLTSTWMATHTPVHTHRRALMPT